MHAMQISPSSRPCDRMIRYCFSSGIERPRNLAIKVDIESLKLIQFSSVSAEPKIERNDDINPYWIEDKELKKGPVAFISPNERQFWVELIDKYLYPIDNDKAEQVMSRTFEKPLIQTIDYCSLFDLNNLPILEIRLSISLLEIQN